MKILYNMLPKSITLFGCGSRVHRLVWWIIRKKKKCPNCGSIKFSQNRLRCCRKGHWFCLDCSVSFITAVDCPVCYKNFDEMENPND